MRIATVVSRFSLTGGIERAAVETTRQLHALGHEVSVYSSGRGSTPLPGIPFHPVPTIDLSGSLSIASFSRSIRSALHPGTYDIIHAHGTESPLYDIITFQSCHKSGLEIQRRQYDPARRRPNFGIADRMRLKAERKVFTERRYKAIIAVSEGVKRELVAMYGADDQDVVAIPNGVRLDQFYPADDDTKSHLRLALGLGPELFVLAFIANEFRRKGLWQIIEAVSLLNNPNVVVLVAGRDSPEAYVKRARDLSVERQFRFLGPATDPARILQSADAFILPTSYEAFSLAMLEGAACGLPVLMTAVHGAEEFIRDGVNGLIIRREPEDIARKIGLLRNDPDLQRAIGRQARRSAEAYGWPEITKRIVDVYTSALQRQ